MINSKLKKFISGTLEYNTFEKAVPAPYIRKSFVSDVKTNSKIIIASCGFYRLFINGSEYTKGFLAPYISNPEHYIYYDEYEILMDKGENVIGIILGNGFQNNPGGYIWDFDKASFRSSPMVSVALTYTNSDGNEVVIESDKSFKTAPSPIRADDYRFGEFYDANYEISGWNEKGFDDSLWSNAIEVNKPCGELKLCTASPIIAAEEIEPVKIFQCGNDYIYDFGVSNAGVCRLRIKGQPGQKIELQHSDSIKDGDLNLENVWFKRELWERDKNIVHKDTYICKSDKEEVYTPTFTYHGFRYVKVYGITAEQATKDLLTYVVLHSDIESRGGFVCSDKTINTLQEMTRRSDISNIHYFPTDCPQREKNGWTADAALSCEQMLLNYAPEKEYKEWLYNICKAQNELGALPGIVPTTGCFYDWGNGPAWDCVLAYLPYYTYIYRGETDMIKIASNSFISYLKYLISRKDEKGLIHIGLGDWCHVGRWDEDFKAPLEVTDTIISMDIAKKIALMFGAVGMKDEEEFALSVSKDFKTAIRENLIDFDKMIVFGDCQTSQAMCLYYNVFNEDEESKAFAHLLDLIHQEGDHMDVGVLGGRVIFHVLSKFGHSELAYKMITRPDFPSYGNWIKRGATTLWEDFHLDCVSSMNHHFWGDISSWFIKCIAGIQLNPDGHNIDRVEIKPSFLKDIDNACGYHISPRGKISSKWEREDNKIILTVEIPKGMSATATLENGFVFAGGNTSINIQSGKYEIKTLLCDK